MTGDNFEGPEAPYTVTLKGGAGFESPWLVLRATSAEDAIALLAEATLNELPEKIAEFAADFRAKSGAAPSAGGDRSSGTSSPRSGRPSTRAQGAQRGAAPQNQRAQQDVEYHPEGLQCDACGEPVFLKSGTSKAGRKYELWACPNQQRKGDGHTADFI